VNRREPRGEVSCCAPTPWRACRTSYGREWAGRKLVRAEAGKRIKELNAWLDDHEMA